MATKQPQTEEQRAVDQFMTRYISLTKELSVDFVSFPQFVPNKEGKFEVVISTVPVYRKAVAPVKDGKIL